MALRQRKSAWCRQLATYLLHLVERRLIDAELLEIILRRLDDPLDDLLVDQTLLSLLAAAAATDSHPHVRAAGVLTTAPLDMAAISS